TSSSLTKSTGRGGAVAGPGLVLLVSTACSDFGAGRGSAAPLTGLGIVAITEVGTKLGCGLCASAPSLRSGQAPSLRSGRVPLADCLAARKRSTMRPIASRSAAGRKPWVTVEVTAGAGSGPESETGFTTPLVAAIGV